MNPGPGASRWMQQIDGISATPKIIVVSTPVPLFINSAVNVAFK